MEDIKYKSESYVTMHRQALFMILIESYKKYKENNYRFIERPEECSIIKFNYLTGSDDIYTWITEEYEKDLNRKYIIITIKDIYKKFICSDLFNSFTREKKGLYTYKFFCNEISKNAFLKIYYIERDKFVNKIRLKSIHICRGKWILLSGWRNRLYDYLAKIIEYFKCNPLKQWSNYYYTAERTLIL